MAKDDLGIPWKQVDREPSPMTGREMAMGHPTAPGLRDPKVVRAGGASPGNGQPGVPMLVPGRRGSLGIPANSGGGFPLQPDLEFLGDSDF